LPGPIGFEKPASVRKREKKTKADKAHSSLGEEGEGKGVGNEIAGNGKPGRKSATNVKMMWGKRGI